MASLDFDKLEQDGFSAEQILDFVRSRPNNFNLEPTFKYYQQQGFNHNEATRATYYDMRNFADFEFKPLSAQPPQPPSQAQKSAQPPSQPPQPQDFNQLKAGIKQQAQQVKQKLQDPKAFLAELNTRAQELEGLSGLGDKLAHAMSLGFFKSDEHAQQEIGYHELTNQAIENNVPYAKLPQSVKNYLANKRMGDLGISDMLSRPFEYFSPTQGEDEYKAQALRQSILKVKDAKDLTEAQKGQIYKDRNIFTTLFNSAFMRDVDDLREYQEQQKSDYLTKAVQRDITLSLGALWTS
ncbi:hypothetical protein [Helicobacter labacensis]|uniref:hypothetical protein n=1 Tax=Helicobacter labacensis TaxID=2316079 RepID=UPI000EAD1CCC|nr:hypothetical protein [Helicobacter labacensis]